MWKELLWKLSSKSRHVKTVRTPKLLCQDIQRVWSECGQRGAWHSGPTSIGHVPPVRCVPHAFGHDTGSASHPNIPSGWCQALSGSITWYINMLIHTAPATSLHWATDAGERIKKRYSLKKHYPHNQKPEIPLRGRKGGKRKRKMERKSGIERERNVLDGIASCFCLVDTRHGGTHPDSRFIKMA